MKENKLLFNEEIANLFKFDQLTGFYTKDFFYRKARERLDEDQDHRYVILCSNIENFKLYNDTYGRQAGDRLLIKLAELCRKGVGESGVYGRYGADRFMFLLDMQHEQLIRQYVKNMIENNRSERIENMSVKLGFYEITDRSMTVEQMCDRALLAVDSITGLYNQFVAVYDDTMRKKILREKDITDVMEVALKEGQFSVYLQPKYSLQNDRMIGAEALVRWMHPELGFMSPGEFIPLFEKNGFIYKLDQFVWEKVCQKLREWKDRNIPLLPVSVNVSRADIYQPDLLEIFDRLINQYEINPKYLHLEITESAYTENPEHIIRTVEALRERGFVIEMDDFGSGYSSLNMLGQMSLDMLKLDMGFIRSEMSKPIERRLLNDVINMAHRMHLSVVAEGVETEEQKKHLKDMGCDFAQGFYYAKPMPAQEYEEILMSYTAEGKTIVPETYYSFPGNVKRNCLQEGSQDMLKKFNDIAELLPGGFFVYKADDIEEIISFNREILKIYGCSTEEEFRELTGNSFRGMVHPDDLVLVQDDISSQIEKENDLDHVEYRIICKDGSVKKVRDHGRFVHSEEYGDVYYVLINVIA